MARDRQEAKRRQAERREARVRERRRAGAERGDAGAGPSAASDGRSPGSGEAEAPRDQVTDPATEARLATAAPPQDAGRSDTVVESPPPLPDLEQDDEQRTTTDSAGRVDTTTDGGRRADAEGRERGRVVSFLVAVWAELQRVQWPNRKTLTTLTGVVLGFVLIAGGYLGALDAIFSRLIQSLL